MLACNICPTGVKCTCWKLQISKTIADAWNVWFDMSIHRLMRGNFERTKAGEDREYLALPV